jgi:hypothetical protein
MRKGINSKAVALTLVALMVGPVVALAEGEMTSSMASMEARLLALEDKLAASEATIAAQRQVLGAQQPAVSEGGLDDFLRSLEIGGHVSASYVYNFNNPDQNTGNAGSGDGGTQTNYQFNTDHNTFSFDAAKIELGKSASEPGSAGFQLDILMGDNAGILRHTSATQGSTDPRASTNRDLADNSFFVDQAYVAYNFQGVELNMGKFYTWMGAEAMDSVENANVTHSMIFTFGIPLWHTGIRAGGELGEGVSWGVGVVNGFNNVTDYGDNKGIIGLLGWEDEMMSVTGTFFMGSEGVRTAAGSGVTVGDENHDTWIFDVVAKAAPTEQLQLWAEGNYGESDGDSDITGSPFGPMKANYGIQLGGQFDLNEKTYIALRGEYFKDDNGARLPNMAFPTPAGGVDEVEVKDLTVTLGYNLTDNLLARLEYRRDMWDARPDTRPFGKHDRGTVPGVGTASNTGGTDSQDVGIFEVSYIFD